MTSRIAVASTALVLTLGLGGCGLLSDDSSSSTSTPFAHPGKGGAVDGTKLSDAVIASIRSAKSYREQFYDDASRGTRYIVQAKKVTGSRTDVLVRSRSGDLYTDYSTSEREDMRVIDGTMYVNMADRSSSADDAGTPTVTEKTGPWMKLSPDQATEMMAGTRAFVSRGGQPIGLTLGTVKALAGRKVTFAGSEGKGDHYTALVPAASYTKSVVAQGVEPSQADFGDSSDPAPAALRYDLWLDHDGRPVDLVVRADASTSAVGGSAGSSPESADSPHVQHHDFDQWGEAVSVSAPPGDQVMDAGGRGGNSR